MLKKKITSKVNAAALQALICRKYVDAKPKGETVIFVVVVHNGVDSLRMFFFFLAKWLAAQTSSLVLHIVPRQCSEDIGEDTFQKRASQHIQSSITLTQQVQPPHHTGVLKISVNR